MVNPFHYSGPVSPDDLIDRDREAAQLLATAMEGNASRLVAPRRFGKTSLLRRLLVEAAGEGWATVYVDFFGVVTLADVAERIERAYSADLRGAMARWFDGLRRTLRPSVRVGAPGADAAVEFTPPRASLLDRLALPRRLHERWGVRVLVVFDEFQGVFTADTNADAIIRSEIQHHGEAASYVFAGSAVGLMHALFTDRRRAFYAQARPVELPVLPPVETAEFIAARFADTGRDVGGGLAPLLEGAAGHPQRTMLLAHGLWDATPEGGRANEAVFAEAWRRTLAELLGEFTTIWRELPVGQRRLLVGVAEDAPPYARHGGGGGGSRGGAVRAALYALIERGDVVRDPSHRSGYRVIDPLLAAWLRDGRPDAV